jgi:uroporphyrinogen-III synthase
MTVCIVTRAYPGATTTADGLKAIGHQPLIIPAAEVKPTFADIRIEGVQALLMTSAAAARNAVLTNDVRHLPVYAVGDATAQAATAAGFVEVISAGGDGAALAVLAADRMKPDDGSLLHLRGSEVAGDVTGMLATCGFQTQSALVYQTFDHADFGNEVTAAIAQYSGAILLHSPAGARRLAIALARWTKPLKHWRVIGLSTACLGGLQDFGFGGLFAADQPDETSLLETLAAL